MSYDLYMSCFEVFILFLEVKFQDTVQIIRTILANKKCLWRTTEAALHDRIEAVILCLSCSCDGEATVSPWFQFIIKRFLTHIHCWKVQMLAHSFMTIYDAHNQASYKLYTHTYF